MRKTVEVARNETMPFELELVTPSGNKGVAMMLADGVRKELGIRGNSEMDPGMNAQGYSRTLSLKGMNLGFEGKTYDDVAVKFYVVPKGSSSTESAFAQIDFVDNKTNIVIAGWTHPDFRSPY